MFNKQNVIFILTLIIALIFIQYNVFVYAQYNILCHEDLYIGQINTDKILEQFLFNVYHGRFISNFIICFLGSIFPKFIGMHPITFYQNVAPFIKGFFLLVIFFQMNLFLYRNKNKDLFFTLSIIFLYLQYQFNFAYQYQDIEYCSFYGFVFPFIFFNLFWYRLIKCIEKNEFCSKKLIFYAFLTGISTEFTNIVTFFAISIILCLLLGQKTNAWQPPSQKLLKNIIASYISLIFGMVLYYTNQGFKGVLDDHAPIFFNLKTLKQEMVHIKPFLYSVFDNAIHEYCFYLILIFALFSILIIKREKLNSIIIAFSLFLGSLFFTVFLISDPMLSPDKTYWTYHFDLIIQYKILFSVLIFYMAGLLIINHKIFLSFIILSVLCFDLHSENKHVLKNMFKNNYKNIIAQNKSAYYQNCKDRYLYEKINLWNIRNNKPLAIINKQTIMRSTEAEIRYINYTYNFHKKYAIIEYNNIEDMYNQYFADGGDIIDKREIDECNFQELLN